jgi:tetratricopeptide (TPR) repeat protein
MALSLIKTALASGENDPQYRCHYAVCLKILGRFAEAERTYWEILREHPESVEATQGLHALYHAIGQCGAIPVRARRGCSPRYQSARHWHRDAARLPKGRT